METHKKQSTDAYTEAGRFIKSTSYTSSSDKPSANPYENQKGSDADTPTTDNRVHCKGCGIRATIGDDVIVSKNAFGDTRGGR